jgi:hypothetical protein
VVVVILFGGLTHKVTVTGMAKLLARYDGVGGAGICESRTGEVIERSTSEACSLRALFRSASH